MEYKSTIVGWDFTNYRQDLEKTTVTHPHVVRREQATTYVDKYALEVITDIDLRAYEQHLHGWSRSYYLRDKHLEAVLAYAQQNTPIHALHIASYQEAIAATKNGFRGLPRVKALDVLTQMDQVSYKPSSAAGYDYIGPKGETNGVNHSRAIRRAKAIFWSVVANDGEGIEHAIQTSVPDVGYTRTQLADLTEKTKVRQVWGRAFHYILLEGLVADPLIKVLTTNSTFIHTGRDPLQSVPQLLSTVGGQCKYLYSLDWKQFDATVSRFEINAAFDIVKELVDFPNYETEQAFEITRQLFIHKKVAAPDGYVYFAHKGIPSGSYYTSVIGSIINKLRIEYIWRLLTGRGPKMCFTLGDDSLVGDDEFTAPSDMSLIANDIGWQFNPDKTEFGFIPESVSFLGRTSRGNMNIRDLRKCLRLLVYPEYPVESGRISAYRARSIAEDAGNISALLNETAGRLERIYGRPSEEEVPTYFKRYVAFQ